MKKEKYLGCIFGLAIGDALGYPVEFKLSNEEVERILRENHPFSQKKALFSDDTQMTLAIAKALIKSAKSNHFCDLENIMKNITDEFVKWYKSNENNRAPGRTCLEGCSKLASGIHWKNSGNPNSKGCGSAMRTAPIGLIYANDLEMLKKVATASSIATHAHPTAIAGSIATAYLVALALKGTHPEEMIQSLIKFTEGISSEFTLKIHQLKKLLPKEPEEAFKYIGPGWVAEEAVAGALYSFMKNPNDFQNTVSTAVKHPGDRDSVACIAGAISGAYNGINAVPEEWRSRIEKKETLESIARQLYNIHKF